MHRPGRFFGEYVANIVYALILFRIRRVPLVLLTIMAAVAILMLSYSAGNLLGGWSKDNWWHGGVRVAYSFCAGLLIHRSGWIIKNGLGFLGLTVLLTLAFVMPFASWNWLAEALVVLFYFPLIVALGAGAVVSKNGKGLCKFSGDISYPLYMTHYAAIWIFGNYYTTYNPSASELILVVITGTMVLIAVAYLAMKYYDIPVRKYLTAKREQRIK
ncbi:MAG: acyltransferase family protein [Chitinophagaceae bacterium]